MAKLRRETHTTLSDAAALRIRAAWLYYNEGLTQKDVAERLGISRSTVIRMLEEARKRAEVQIWISDGVADCVDLAVRLEKAYGLDEAVVVPSPDRQDAASIAKAVGLALGQFLTEVVTDDMTIGVGWGRTMTASLAGFRSPAGKTARWFRCSAASSPCARPTRSTTPGGWQASSAPNATCSSHRCSSIPSPPSGR